MDESMNRWINEPPKAIYRNILCHFWEKLQQVWKIVVPKKIVRLWMHIKLCLAGWSDHRMVTDSQRSPITKNPHIGPTFSDLGSLSAWAWDLGRRLPLLLSPETCQSFPSSSRPCYPKSKTCPSYFPALLVRFPWQCRPSFLATSTWPRLCTSLGSSTRSIRETRHYRDYGSWSTPIERQRRCFADSQWRQMQPPLPPRCDAGAWAIAWSVCIWLYYSWWLGLDWPGFHILPECSAFPTRFLRWLVRDVSTERRKDANEQENGAGEKHIGTVWNRIPFFT